MSEKPTVFLIDTDPDLTLIVEEIAKQMQVNFETFATAEAFLEASTSDRTGCVVAEIRLMGMGGIELQERLAKDAVPLPMIFVTAYAETSFVVEAIQHGAVTVLAKPPSEQSLWEAVRDGLARNRQARANFDRRAELTERLSTLTTKERKVLDLIVQGKSNKSIAKILKLSVRTVETRRQQVFIKTGASSIVELARLILLFEMENPESRE